MQTEKSQPEGKRIIPETKFSGIIRWPDGWDFPICIGDRCLIIFLTYDIKIIKYYSSSLLFKTFYVD